jgi:hypothetical protein
MLDIDDLITQSEAARLRGRSRQAISNLVEKGRLTVIEIGGIRFVSKKEILTFQAQSPGRKPKL